jgi:hypothetical protein
MKRTTKFGTVFALALGLVACAAEVTTSGTTVVIRAGIPGKC